MSNCVLGKKLLALHKLEALIHLREGDEKRILYESVRVLGEQIVPLLENAEENCFNRDPKCDNCPLKYGKK